MLDSHGQWRTRKTQNLSRPNLKALYHRPYLTQGDLLQRLSSPWKVDSYSDPWVEYGFTGTQVLPINNFCEPWSTKAPCRAISNGTAACADLNSVTYFPTSTKSSGYNFNSARLTIYLLKQASSVPRRQREMSIHVYSFHNPRQVNRRWFLENNLSTHIKKEKCLGK